MMGIQSNSAFASSSNATSPYAYAQAIEELQNSGCLSLASIQELSYADLNHLCEEIKCWCVYGNHDPKKLRTVPHTSN